MFEVPCGVCGERKGLLQNKQEVFSEGKFLIGYIYRLKNTYMSITSFEQI